MTSGIPYGIVSSDVGGLTISLDQLYGLSGQGPSRTPASESVLNLLRKLIAQGDLRPGQRLPNEHDLANRLGISRASLREGMRALAAMNIVVVRHGDGTFVSSLDPELLAEPLQLVLAIEDSAVFSLFEMRRITEPAAAALAAERATTEELDALQDEIKAGIEAHGDALKLVEHDSRLHQLIHLAAHNPILRSVSASLAGLANSVRKRTVRLPRNAPLTIAEHTEVVEAICARDAESASRAMTVHLARVENDLRAYPAAGLPDETQAE